MSEDEENKIVNLRGIAIISAFVISSIILYFQTSQLKLVWKSNRNFSPTHELRVHGINVSDNVYSDKNL